MIVEDLLLLLLDDKTGTIAGEGTLHLALGGAVIAELALTGNVQTEEQTMFHGVKVRVRSEEPPTDPLLRSAYDKIAEGPRGVQTLLLEIGSGLRSTVLDRLLHRGLMRRETRKWLRIFTATSLPTNAPHHEAAMLETVRVVLEDGAEPNNAREAALIALLSATGTLPQFHPAISWSSKVFRRGKDLEDACWAAQAVGVAMTRTAAANSLASSSATAVALATGR